MKKFEYRHVFTKEYNFYLEKANELLNTISFDLSKDIIDLSYQDIICYFQSNYNIHFAFFEANPLEFPENNSWEVDKIENDQSWIKHKNLISNASFEFLDNEIVERISGITIPHGDRTLIFINQDRPFRRIIFTILHELCHYYFHIRNNSKALIFTSLNSEQLEGKYSDELIPFENEANIIGSILFCPTEKLEHMLLCSYNFKDMCRYTQMSESAMHNRLLNYFKHILHLNNQNALNFVLKIRNGQSHIYGPINYKISAKLQNQEKASTNLYSTNIICEICHFKPNEIGSKFCPICASKKTKLYNTLSYLKKEKVMKYSIVKTNSQGTPLDCPKCGTDNLEDNFNYCPYCALFIHNMCLGSNDNRFIETSNFGDYEEKSIYEQASSACGEYLDGGYRYCPKCGNETSFLRQKLLKNWEEELSALEASKKEKDLFFIEEDIDIPNEDLPF